MHIDEYKMVEKSGIQLGVGTTKSGLCVLLYASFVTDSVASISSEKYRVVSTSNPEKILSALDDNESITEVLSNIEGEVSFAAISLSDKSSVLGRKANGKVEVWNYNRFDGFGHVLSSSSDLSPSVIDWYDSFSQSAAKLWDALKGYKELVVDCEGGVRRFIK